MNDQEQLELIKEFMLKLSPAVLQLEYQLLENEHERMALPEKVAQMTLNVAMHLAGQYRSCYDQLHREKEPTSTGRFSS